MWFNILWIWNISLTFWETVTLRSDSKFTLCGNLVTMALLAEKETSQRHMEPRQKPAPAVSTESQHSLSNPNHQFCVCEIQLVNGYLLLCSSLSCKWNTSWKMQLLYIFNKGAERHITSISLDDLQNQWENSISKIFPWTDMRIIIYGLCIALDKILYNMNIKYE